MFATSDPRQLNSAAVQLQAEGRCREALNAFLEAARVYRALGDQRGEGRCLNGAGACYKDIGEIDNARKYLEDALKLRVRTGDALGEAITLTTLGPVYQLTGRGAEAQQALKKALRLTETLGAYDRRGQVLYNLASVAETAGRLAQAYAWYEEAQNAALLAGNDIEVAKCTGGMTNVSLALGMDKEAFELANRWLRESKATGNVRGVSCALHALGVIHHGLHKNDEARRELEQSIDIDMKSGAPAEAAASMAFLAEVLHALGRRDEARRKAEEALAVARQLRSPRAELFALEALGGILAEAGSDARALETFEEFVEAARRAGARIDEAWALSGVALMYDRRGQRPKALALLDEACRILDDVRGDLSHDRQRFAFFTQREIQSAYGIYVDLLLKESFAAGDRALAERAFNVRERSLTRALLDFLYAKGFGDGRSPLAPATVTLAEVQQLLDPGTALVEYSVHKGVSYAFVVSRDAFDVVQLPPSQQIRDAISPTGIEQGDVAMLREAAPRLHTTIFQPVEQHLGGRTHIIVVPSDALAIVPFQMLAAPGDASSQLLDRYTISYAPSASVLRTLSRDRSAVRPMDFLGLAPVCDSDLPQTAPEVTNIGALFGPKATIRLGHEATKSSLASLRLGDYRYVHFATHGLCDTFDANGSALLMSGSSRQESLLYTYEIADLPLDADLVVLSACETGLGVPTHGEGLIGLTRAFLCAGTSAVLATLWSVDDPATSALMQRFYGHLQQSIPPVEALRRAQLELRADPKWSDPYYWAGFVLMGP